MNSNASKAKSASVSPRRPKGPRGACAVGGFVPQLTRKAFEKYGFATAALATDWTTIVGEATARKCQPERLNWPRLPRRHDDLSEPGANRPGATLILATDPAFALEIQYQIQQLTERLNAYFGYRAIAEIRIRQTSLRSLSLPHAEQRGRASNSLPRDHVKPRPQKNPPSLASANIANDKLREALARLEQSLSDARR